MQQTAPMRDGELPLDPDVGPADEPHPRSLTRLVAIGLGGGAGAFARHELELAFPAGDGAFPWTTFLIDVSGAFALAVLVVFVVDRWSPMEHVQPFACVGFCGGFTTFSTFMMETVLLTRDGHPQVGALYVGVTLVAGVTAILVGIRIAHALDRRLLT